MATVSSDSVAQDQLRAFIERIERLEEEKAAISEDIKEIYAEAKGNGFDTKVLRKIVTIRKQDHNERMEQEALIELYLTALGMASGPSEEDVERALTPAQPAKAFSLPGSRAAGLMAVAVATWTPPPPDNQIGFDFGSAADE